MSLSLNLGKFFHIITLLLTIRNVEREKRLCGKVEKEMCIVLLLLYGSNHFDFLLVIREISIKQYLLPRFILFF
jgi:hypothetical protein